MISTYFHPFPILAAFTLLIMLAPGDSRAMDIMEAKNPMARGYGLDVMFIAPCMSITSTSIHLKKSKRACRCGDRRHQPPCKIDELKKDS